MAQITAGIKLKYGTGAGDTKPTTWTTIPGITEMPEMNSEPESIETTTLDNTQTKTYIPGLADVGGSLGFTANDTPEFRTAWKAAVTAGKCWFAIEVPDPIGEQLVFRGKASPLGFGGAGANAVLTTTGYITPETEPAWEKLAAE